MGKLSVYPQLPQRFCLAGEKQKNDLLSQVAFLNEGGDSEWFINYL